MSGVLFVGSGYQAAFGWLLIPAVLSMAVLLAARFCRELNRAIREVSAVIRESRFRTAIDQKQPARG